MPKSLAIEKPVKLQVNTAGAWKDVVSFDAADAAAADHVMQGAALICAGAQQAKFRVVIADSLQTALSHWTLEKGWVDA
ncbi:hypothetical protein MCEMSHM24_02727 [Comamonadaceae bacterium]